ncbi:MAG: NAD(P)H-hydrate epimerase [Candidatus Omnitrophica bacterium]|nr:NAD(P)H-hydrate epimerase [Candidatus Omnitrophota bacterium]
MAEIDRRAIEEYGIPSLILMENAGRCAAEVALEMLKKQRGKRISLFSGKGNNGGDGMVAARHLMNKGYDITCYLLGKREEIVSEAVKKNLQILEKMKVAMREISNLDSLLKFRREIENSSLLLDAIFGIGLKGEVKSPYKEIIEFLNSLKKPVLSLDIPSGLDADTGIVSETAIVATRTVTFALPKKGLFLNDGPKFSGKITVAEISIPKQLFPHKSLKTTSIFTF